MNESREINSPTQEIFGAKKMNDRIEQFRKMAQANPDDDLAHFALGNALVEGERYGEAVPVLKHVLKINAGYSRAYVLLANSLKALDDEPECVDVLQRGYAAAMVRGELMPANEMKTLLTAMGESIDAEYLLQATEDIEEQPEDDREPGEGEIRCHRSKKVGPKLKFNPFGDAIGEFIQENINADTWNDWMEMSIKVINELRLDLGDPNGQRIYDEHMKDFLNLPASLFEAKTQNDA